jgi:sigma-B regulation protein RsbU (phosphoserine phosphatase)
MKFRWKLLILLLSISIIPVVSLRIFGIHNVHLMGDALVAAVRTNRVDEAKHQLQLVIKGYSKDIRTIREQVEMALFYQMFELRRILQKELLQPDQNNSSPVSGPLHPPANKTTGSHSDASLATGKDADEITRDDKSPCFSVPPSMDAEHVKLDIVRLKAMTPIYQAVSQYLGNLVLWQYFGLENGLFSVYPCCQKTPLSADATRQAWYKSALEDKATAWSRPYVDPISGRMVMAVSVPVEREDESIVGVTSLLVSLNSLMEQESLISGLPEGTRSYLYTLAFNPSTRMVGAKVLAAAHHPEIISGDLDIIKEHQWLVSSDATEFSAMLDDIAKQQHRIREMPFNGRMSFWAYGPLLHQGTAFVFIVPRDEILPVNHPVLKSIQNRVRKLEHYTVGFLIFLVLAAAVLALTFSRTITRPLEKLSQAAQKLAKGDFDSRVSIKSRDELGDMGHIFNRVGPQLKEHYRMQRSLEVAMQIQQNLLPEGPPIVSGLEIFGMTLFSDETGGDYFDYLCIDDRGQSKLCVAVGDVSGHGIPSALLMATVRAFFRMRSALHGSLGDIVADVNREFSKDVGDSGQFMTFFLARIDRSENLIEWVRAGHDPAILYDPAADSFKNLNKGKGLPLGVSEDAAYKESFCEIRPGQIIYIGTDGIWEARNAEGNIFGKERLEQVIRKYNAESAQTIVLSILDAVRDFCGIADQEDDLTLMVIKVKER